MEDDSAKFLRLFVELHLEIGVVEEFRIRQARGEDLAVAFDDLRAAIRRIDIGGADEGVGEISLRIAADEIFLVHARGQLDHLGRDIQERGVEAAEQGHGPFGQPGILGQQTVVLDQLQPGLARGHRCAERDDLAAFVLIDDDMAGAQLLRIIGRGADGDGARMVETMADRRRTAGDARNLAGHDLLAEQSDDALQRANPFQAFGGAAGIAPAHRFRPGERANDVGDRLGQYAGGGAAGTLDHGEQHAVALDQLLAGQTGLAQEAVQRLRRGGGFRALGLFADRRRLGGQRAGDERQATGGGVGGEVGRDDPGFAQLGDEQAGEIVARLVLHARGNFFGAEFEQEIGHAVHPG